VHESEEASEYARRVWRHAKLSDSVSQTHRAKTLKLPKLPSEYDCFVFRPTTIHSG